MSDTVVKKTMKADATAITKDDVDKATQYEAPKHPDTCVVPKNEQELVALVNVLGLDWAKIAAVLAKAKPSEVKADPSELNKVVLGGTDEVIKALPPIIAPSPTTVSPPRILAPE